MTRRVKKWKKEDLVPHEVVEQPTRWNRGERLVQRCTASYYAVSAAHQATGQAAKRWQNRHPRLPMATKVANLVQSLRDAQLHKLQSEAGKRLAFLLNS